MDREHAHIGMLVMFGIREQEQTLGQIVKLNPARAKVETLEARGGRPAGTRFNVPYELIQPAEEKQAPAT